MKSKRSKATDIPPEVKRAVWDRDDGACVVCGNMVNVMPNAHYIPRSRGGLGIEENIVTLCTPLTINNCHHKYDNGDKETRELYKSLIKKYLMSKYPNWDESKLYYTKWGQINE